MSKKNEIKKTPSITFFLVAVVLLFIQPLLIHFFLKIPAPFDCFVRYWRAGDLITYVAGFEAFVGTLYLGIVAANQSKEANLLSKGILDIETQREERAITPNIVLRNIQGPNFFTFGEQNSRAYLSSLAVNLDTLGDNQETFVEFALILSNATSLITGIHFYMFDVQKDIPRRYFSSERIQEDDISLRPNDEKRIEIEFPVRIFLEERSLDVYISLDLTSQHNLAVREFIHFVVSCDNEGIKYAFRENTQIRLS